MIVQIQKTFVNEFSAFFTVSCFIFLTIAGAANANGGVKADFDGDGKSDISVFRPSDGFWYIAKSSGGFSSIRWGLSTDVPTPGDYDGDGKTDVAVYRYGSFSPTGNPCFFYVLRSSDNSFFTKQWGTTHPFASDAPIINADFDGDRVTDFTVYEGLDYIPAPVRFKVLRSSDNAANTTTWGFNIDRRALGDYDGDGKDDIAVFRGGSFTPPPSIPSDQLNVWYILQSSNGLVRNVRFGLAADQLVPADYDGDGKTDIAVWRPSDGVWYRINSRDGSFSAFRFGLSDDRPVPADYDGDGKTDIAVFRPSTGIWYIQRSTGGFYAQQFGQSGDTPIPALR